MRAGIGRNGLALAVALAAAVAGTGCQALGLHEANTRDMSDQNTKAGTYVVNEGNQKVKVTKFTPNFTSAPGSVEIEFVNEGGPQEFVAFDVEFGYPAPADAIAPYVPEFVEVSFENFTSGKTEKKTVPGGIGAKSAPLFARVLPVSGADVRMTTYRETPDSGLRRGTTFLGNKVEVVKMEANLTPPEGTKPSISFTLESQAESGEVGAIRYMVQFFKDGKPMDLGRRYSIFRPASKPLGKKGDTVVVDVTVDTAASLAGVKPVLRVIQ
jgi:hypothetical protein